jgi:hypothetical protein
VKVNACMVALAAMGAYEVSFEGGEVDRLPQCIGNESKEQAGLHRQP